jgi:hypothetical protein
MSFPVVAASNTSSQNAAVTTHTISLAGGSSGDLLIAVMAFDKSPSYASGKPGINNPGANFGPIGGNLNWGVILGRWQDQPSSTLTLQAVARISNGAEGASFSCNTSVSCRSAHQTFRITGQGNGLIANTANGSSTSSDPPPAFATWFGQGLWFAVVAVNDNITFTLDPSDYTHPIENRTTNGSSGVKLRTVRRNLLTNGGIEDPGTFATSSTSPWATATFAIGPLGGQMVLRGFRGGP